MCFYCWFRFEFYVIVFNCFYFLGSLLRFIVLLIFFCGRECVLLAGFGFVSDVGVLLSIEEFFIVEWFMEKSVDVIGMLFFGLYESFL